MNTCGGHCMSFSFNSGRISVLRLDKAFGLGVMVRGVVALSQQYGAGGGTFGVVRGCIAWSSGVANETLPLRRSALRESWFSPCGFPTIMN